MSEDALPAAVSRRIDQIIDMAALGWTDKRIAAELGISAHTVETHWKRLRERLGVPNRTTAVLASLRARIEEQNRQLREANEALERLHDSRRAGMNALLTDAQKRLVEATRGQ